MIIYNVRAIIYNKRVTISIQQTALSGRLMRPSFCTLIVACAKLHLSFYIYTFSLQIIAKREDIFATEFHLTAPSPDFIDI